MHEAKALEPRPGGHVLLKHVGKDEAWLRDRLRREPKRKVVSSFAGIEQAERAISETLHSDVVRIRTWTRISPRNSTLEVSKVVAGDVGYGIRRETGKLTRMNKVIVVLKNETYNGMPYYILSAYVE
jgi:hypothetical protein